MALSVSKNSDTHHVLLGVSQTAKTNNSRIVASGIDTFSMGFCITQYLATEEDFSVLAAAKLKAQGKGFNKDGCPFTWFGQDFMLSPKGTRGYEWVLVNSDVSICIAKSAKGGASLPEVRAYFRSEFLWRVGFKLSYGKVLAWLKTWCVVCAEKVSRVDLTVDMSLALPNLDLANEVVTRARSKTEHREENKLEKHYSGSCVTGYSFGRREMILARIYNKPLEIKVQSHKEWFYDIWKANGWDCVAPVTRFEFQVNRKILHEYQVDSFSDLTSRLGDIWRYLTVNWLTLRTPGRTKEHYRWAVKDYWQELQNCTEERFGKIEGVLRWNQKNPILEQLKKTIRGTVVTGEAVSQEIHGSYSGSRDFRSWLFSIFDEACYQSDVAGRRKRLAEFK